MTNSWLAPFGLADCQVQTWASAGTYNGTMTDVASIQQIGVTQQVTQAQLTGDNQITATAANTIGATAKLRFGGLNFDSLGIILEVTVQLVPDATYGVYNLIQYPTDFTIAVFPPANIATVS
jgi:hypothetical protein